MDLPIEASLPRRTLTLPRTAVAMKQARVTGIASGLFCHVARRTILDCVQMPLVGLGRCRTETTAAVEAIGVWSQAVAIPRAEVIKLARAHSELILELETGTLWIHRQRSVAWLVEIIPGMAANDCVQEPVFFSPGVSFSFPLALIAGNRESLENALRHDIELAAAVASGEVLVDRGDAAPLVRLARQLVAAPGAWKIAERRLKTGGAAEVPGSGVNVCQPPLAGDGEHASVTMVPGVSPELAALLERRRALQRSIRRARAVLASEPNTRLESVCSQATRSLAQVRAQLEAELAEAPAPWSISTV